MEYMKNHTGKVFTTDETKKIYYNLSDFKTFNEMSMKIGTSIFGYTCDGKVVVRIPKDNEIPEGAKEGNSCFVKAWYIPTNNHKNRTMFIYKKHQSETI